LKTLHRNNLCIDPCVLVTKRLRFIFSTNKRPTRPSSFPWMVSVVKGSVRLVLRAVGKRGLRTQHTAAIQVALGDGWYIPLKCFGSLQVRVGWGMGPHRPKSPESARNRPSPLRKRGECRGYLGSCSTKRERAPEVTAQALPCIGGVRILPPADTYPIPEDPCLIWWRLRAQRASDPGARRWHAALHADER
jgi:hypothetical protein